MDDELRGVLAKEQKAHPDCNFSLSQSSACSSKDGGDYVCEVIASLMKKCPGKRAVEVYRKTDKSDQPQGESIFGGEVDSLFSKWFVDPKSSSEFPRESDLFKGFGDMMVDNDLIELPPSGRSKTKRTGRRVGPGENI